MILDFHAHILQGVDHGSASIETSIKQLELACRYGVDSIVATSHFYPQSRSCETFFERRDYAYDTLVKEADVRGVKLLLGAEVLVCNAIDRHPDIDRLCISGTKTILLELPFADFQTDYCRSVFNLVNNGYEVIMAHADRYNPSWIEETLEAGAKLQLNAVSLSLFSRKRYLEWLENGDVVAIGSDIHGADKKAYKCFAKAEKFVSKYPALADFSHRILSR